MGIREAAENTRQLRDFLSEAADQMERLNAAGEQSRNTFEPDGVQRVQPGPGVPGSGITPRAPQGGFSPLLVDAFGRPIAPVAGTVSGGPGGGGGGSGFRGAGPAFGPTVGSSSGGGFANPGTGERRRGGPPTLTGAQYLGGVIPGNQGLQTAGQGVTAGDKAVVEAIQGLRDDISRARTDVTPTAVRAAR